MVSPERIKRVSIHPGVGIARIGNAADDYFIAPQVPGEIAGADEGWLVEDGDESLIKRQAAKFRVYAELDNGERVELTAADAQIEWRVQLANLKAGWYQFRNAMDLPEAYVEPAPLRNSDIAGAARDNLDIRPTPASISGSSESGDHYSFRDGRFFGKSVYLGELATDPAGRLLVLGGLGGSSHRVPGTRPNTFANNDGWHDDIADGPVFATVTVDDQVFEAEPAFVAVAPPNYGPGLFGVVTMLDVVHDLYVAQGWETTPARPSFTRNIWPLFDRLTGNQWINHGVFMLAGHGSPLDTNDTDVVTRLADPSEAARPFRTRVFELFRAPNQAEARTDALPPFYGDTFAEYLNDGRVDLAVTETLYAHLKAWADGDFDADWNGRPGPADFDALPPEQQIDALDKACLYECLGGPFHPGIELTWTLRRIETWRAPYHLTITPEGTQTRQDYGPELTRAACLAGDGPVSSNGPGSLTRWLGVPWQTDEASCNSSYLYTPSWFLSSPSFWGARVPNQVLSTESFNRISDERSSSVQRFKHFAHRVHWTRDINGGEYADRIANMVNEWWKIGVVAPVDLPAAEDAELPGTMHVETGRSKGFAGDDPTEDLIAAVESIDHPSVAGFAPEGLPTKRRRRPPLRRFGRGDV